MNKTTLPLNADTIDEIIATIGGDARKFTNADNGQQAVAMSDPEGGDPFYFLCEKWDFKQYFNGACAFSPPFLTDLVGIVWVKSPTKPDTITPALIPVGAS